MPIKFQSRKIKLATVFLSTVLALTAQAAQASTAHEALQTRSEARFEAERTTYHTVSVDGVNIFYREAGPKNAPTLLLLHGFPSSSHMFRDLIPMLSDRYHIIAPDYPGFGQSDAPPQESFDYTFDHLSEIIDKFSTQLGLSHYALYLQDYGAPIGFRMASAHPERVTAIVVQNGNAYEEGFNSFWDPIKAYWRDRSAANGDKLRHALGAGITKWQYTEGASDGSRLNPDAWTIDQAYLNRPGNDEIQLSLFYSYGSNPPLYPKWQAYLREHRPPMLILWGKNDKTFSPAGASAYLRDLPSAELHMLDTGHFALEDKGPQMGQLMRVFLGKALHSKQVDR